MCAEFWHIDNPFTKRDRRACYIETIKNRAHHDWLVQHTGHSVGDEGIKSSHLGRQLLITTRGYLVEPETEHARGMLYSAMLQRRALERTIKNRR